jgi:hypothetical protein
VTITEKSFILVQEDTNVFIVDNHLEACIRHEMRPILWYRMGMFQVVPTEILQNMLGNLDDADAIATQLNGQPPYVDRKIDWKQTFPAVDGRPMQILAGLEY